MDTFSFRRDPPEVMLKEDPLKRVLCQVRFSANPELIDDDHEIKLASELRDQFPVRNSVQGVALQLFGTTPAVQRLRTFEDIEGVWKVTVAPDFVAVETSRYKNRDGFLAQLSGVLAALGSVSAPALVTRVGIRYTDQIEMSPELADWVNPALLGCFGHVDAHNVEIQNQVITALLRNRRSGSAVQVRSLILPGGAQIDAGVEPEAFESWVLDLDSAVEGREIFDVARLEGTARDLAHDAYRVFYWAVTDEFRKAFRGGGTS
ncbi:MAG: TIGR04255 family protein [Candidatus Nanopelagicales bacterium]|nr:TIGR04255 family protein [Candidatus Nanopelagicales bacterium]MDZ4249637.1 TIGR04255 family protein [Candidatus Nanopelagicales bacterium]